MTLIILCDQLSRAIHIGHMIRQIIGNGCGQCRNTLVGFQLELVVDIGLAICAIARRYFNIVSRVKSFRS